MENYIQTPFNYTGSKYKLLSQLLPEFDYNKSKFMDVFAGGGSVFTNVLNKYEKIYVNDIIADLIHVMGLINSSVEIKKNYEKIIKYIQ
jgi:site-specific DNA-adenine methylase